MTIEAEVIADSVSSRGIRLTTVRARYPKFIHGELMTHRVFSRNASSSRAIPVRCLIEEVERDPARPVFWGKNRPGMTATEEMTEEERDVAITRWLSARDAAVDHAREMARIGVHKQLVNRVIEPWAHITVLITATHWVNFFALRRHPAAQPEMRALADAIWNARAASLPAHLRAGEWHLPFVDRAALAKIMDVDRPMSDRWRRPARVSAARCARVSYLHHDGREPTIDEDLALFDRLAEAKPMHASPMEHQATPDALDSSGEWGYPDQHGNFFGWRQHRKMLKDESVREVIP